MSRIGTKIKKCDWCGSKIAPHAPSGNRFCDRQCYRLWRRTVKGYNLTLTDDQRAKLGQRMVELRKRPDVRQKLAAHCVSPENRLMLSRAAKKGREIQQDRGFRHLILAGIKGRETLRRLGYPHLREHAGGNGRGPTVPQKILFDALAGAALEHPIPTGLQHPPVAKVDLAVVPLKLAIEVDGQTHKAAKVKQTDAKKDQLLKQRGWTVLRFWNQEILRDLPSVLNRIHETITSLEKGAEPNAILSR